MVLLKSIKFYKSLYIFGMNKDISTKELINELVRRLNIKYGNIEIKIHDSNWTNYQVTTRVNFNDFETTEILNSIKE